MRQNVTIQCELTAVVRGLLYCTLPAADRRLDVYVHSAAATPADTNRQTQSPTKIN